MSVFLDIVSFWNKIQKSDHHNAFSKKIIGVDYGTKKIGIAVSDEDRNFAFPKETLLGNWKDVNYTVEAIYYISKKYNTNCIVIGLPKTLNGTYSIRCDHIIKIANLLDRKMKNKNAVIVLFDERFSTKATMAVCNTRTARCIKSRKIKQIFKNTFDDEGAASVILNDVLRCKPKTM